MTKEILASYKKAAIELLEVTKYLTAEQVSKVPEDNEWPISYIVHHLFDAETYFATRYMNILVYDNPEIISFDEELLPIGLKYQNRSFEASLKGIAGIHAVIEDLLTYVTDEQWARTGKHFNGNLVSLSEVLTKATGHIEGHLDQIKKSL